MTGLSQVEHWDNKRKYAGKIDAENRGGIDREQRTQWGRITDGLDCCRWNTGIKDGICRAEYAENRGGRIGSRGRSGGEWDGLDCSRWMH